MLPNDIIDSLYVENVQSSARKRKTEDATNEKIVKIKMTSDSGLELPLGSGMSRIGPNPEHLAKVWLSAAKNYSVLFLTVY